MAVKVHGADLLDRDGGRRLLAEDLQRELPRLELVWATERTRAGSAMAARRARVWQVEVLDYRDGQL